MGPTKTLLATDLFARIHSMRNEGRFECHWCAAPCGDRYKHDDEPIVPFRKYNGTAKRPANHFVCNGCLAYHRKYVTVRSLTNKIKDRKCIANHSWWMCKDGVWVINSDDYTALYENLLFPPLCFGLSLLRTEPKSHIHLIELNDFEEIKNDTPLTYSLDNRILTYTVYELEQGLRYGSEGKMPGVRALIDLLGPFQLPDDGSKNNEDKRGRGRPRTEPGIKENPTKKIISK